MAEGILHVLDKGRQENCGKIFKLEQPDQRKEKIKS